MGVNMSLKIHFLHWHLDENLVSTSDAQGERFHHDVKFLEIDTKAFGMKVC
jgi:hypothetical protein